MRRRRMTSMIAALLAGSVLGAAPAGAQDSGPPIRAAQIERALARYRSEPSVDRVVRAALQTGAADPSRTRDAMDRARATGWLPTTRASLRRGQAVDLRALAGADGAPTNVSTGDDLSFEASMTFRFDRIVFAAEEVALLRELRAVEDARAELARAVVRLYFERRRLQLERDLLGQIDVVREVRILECEALLDVFTSGAFTRMMAPRSQSSEQ